MAGKDGLFTAGPRSVQCDHYVQYVQQLADNPSGQDADAIRMSSSSACGHCGDSSDSWICLNCNVKSTTSATRADVLCGRFAGGHLRRHYYETAHPLALSLIHRAVWCFDCGDYMQSDQVICLIDWISFRSN